MQITHGERWIGSVVRAVSRVPQGHSHARKQLANPEWLTQVVIRPGVQGRNLVPFLASGRQDDNRYGAPLPKPPDNLEPVHVGETEIENHDVGLAGSGFDKARLSRVCLEEAVSAVSQGHAEEASDRRIVFDDKDDRSPG